jgi:hypothetical protein
MKKTIPNMYHLQMTPKIIVMVEKKIPLQQ